MSDFGLPTRARRRAGVLGGEQDSTTVTLFVDDQGAPRSTRKQQLPSFPQPSPPPSTVAANTASNGLVNFSGVLGTSTSLWSSAAGVFSSVQQQSSSFLSALAVSDPLASQLLDEESVAVDKKFDPHPTHPSSASRASPVPHFEVPTQPLPIFSSFPAPLPVEIVEMPTRDRTAEFQTTAKSYQLRARPATAPPRAGRQAAVQDGLQFNLLAKRIGRDLSMTCAKLEQLMSQARSRSILDERAQAEQLARIIKEDITGLNKQILLLQEYSKTRQSGRKGQDQTHSSNVVVGLQTKLATVSKQFQSTLEMRTETMKAERERRNKFVGSNGLVDSVPPLPSTSSAPNIRRSLLAEDDEKAGVAVDMSLLAPHSTQTQLLVGDATSYAQARSTAMESIESSISELGQIFSQLASLVSEQGEVITRIDSNVEDTVLNVEMAHTELVRFLHTISKNRWLMLKVFGVLMAFFVFFIVFLA